MINDRELALYSPYIDRCGTTDTGKYILMDKAGSYAQGMHTLQQAATFPHPTITLRDGRKVYRPLTFAETIKARCEDYNSTYHPDGSERSVEERLVFLNEWLWTGTGVAHHEGTTNFKLVPAIGSLAALITDFTDSYIRIDYAFTTGIEIDSRKRGQKYNKLLTPDEVLKNEGWITAVEGNVTLLREYRNIVIAARKEKGWSTERLMGFWLTDSPSEDQLRALFVYSLNSGFNAIGDCNLSDGGSFLLVAPRDCPGTTQ